MPNAIPAAVPAAQGSEQADALVPKAVVPAAQGSDQADQGGNQNKEEIIIDPVGVEVDNEVDRANVESGDGSGRRPQSRGVRTKMNKRVPSRTLRPPFAGGLARVRRFFWKTIIT